MSSFTNGVSILCYLHPKGNQYSHLRNKIIKKNLVGSEAGNGCFIYCAVKKNQQILFFISALSAPETSSVTQISLIGFRGDNLIWKQKQGYLAIWLPQMSKLPESLRSNTAWTIKLTGLKNN